MRSGRQTRTMARGIRSAPSTTKTTLAPLGLKADSILFRSSRSGSMTKTDVPIAPLGRAQQRFARSIGRSGWGARSRKWRTRRWCPEQGSYRYPGGHVCHDVGRGVYGALRSPGVRTERQRGCLIPVHSPRPSTLRRNSSVIEVTPSFSSSRLRCCSTVRWLIASSFAIVLLGSPFSASDMTSRSRAVNGKGVPPRLRCYRWVARCAISRRSASLMASSSCCS